MNGRQHLLSSRQKSRGDKKNENFARAKRSDQLVQQILENQNSVLNTGQGKKEAVEGNSRFDYNKFLKNGDLQMHSKKVSSGSNGGLLSSQFIGNGPPAGAPLGKSGLNTALDYIQLTGDQQQLMNASLSQKTRGSQHKKSSGSGTHIRISSQNV